MSTQAQTPPTASGNAKGVAFMIVTTIIFAAQDGLSKALAENHSPILITMWRYWFFGAVCLVLLWRQGFANGLRSGQPALQIYRGVTLALQICVAVASFHIVGLSKTHSIFAFLPLLIVALSGPVLGERVGWRRWAAVGVGFLGMMLIIRPGKETLDWDLAIPLIGMLMFATYGLATRKVARTDGAMTSFYYTGVFGALVMTFIGPWFWTPMNLHDAVLMAILCVSGMTGHFLLIKALEAAEASAVQPFTYLHTVFAIGVGVTVFGEVVSPWTILGCAVVIGAGVFAFWREAVRARESRASR